MAADETITKSGRETLVLPLDESLGSGASSLPTNVDYQHETEISLEGEAGLERHLSLCTKHPKHKEFIPVHRFSLHDLPEDYQDVDIVTLVQTLAALTVRVSVTYTSLNRPQFHPRSNAKYPMYELRGKSVLRTGSGRIWGVRKYTEDSCPCSKCKSRGEASKVWGRVYVYTATHVVFDSSEGMCSEVLWGYDQVRRDAKVIQGVAAGVFGDLERDRCILNCVTCDEDLLDKLAQLVTDYKKLYIRVFKKYSSSARDDRLTVVVSHPHGRAKAVTVGCWINRHNFSDQRGLIDTTYTYNAATCAGSSGAPVFLLGKVWYTLAHSGTSTNGNYSSGGWGV
ncbi:STE20 serine/threonine-protein kinase isoform X2 [Biomphalaria glabrata]|nr:STE20 serine/threonine-protein kinase isoform X2 [Biomphalaria glabrata]